MYTLLRHARSRDGLMVEGPAAAIALVIAEVFYKFHSFSLECVAFLGTWLAISWIASVALGPLLRRKGAVKSSA